MAYPQNWKRNSADTAIYLIYTVYEAMSNQGIASHQ